MNQEPRTCLRWILPLAMILGAGCAPAYHSYSGCYVNCKYCAPPPLPYAHFEGCVCHSCVASKHLSGAPRPGPTPTLKTELAPMPEGPPIPSTSEPTRHEEASGSE